MAFNPFKHKKRAKQSHSLVGDVFSIALLVILGSFMALPLVLAISNSLKPLEELFIFPPRFFVRNPTLDNFHDVFVLMSGSWVPFARYTFNTVFITLVGTFGHLIIASLCAYALAKYKFPGQKVIFWIIVTALMFSTQVTAIPNYLIMSKIGWLDSYASLIVPAIAKPLGLFLMKQFMEQLPDSLLEAARIDGASEFKVFWKIAMPQVKPAWLTLIIFCFQDLWNLQGSNYIFSEELKTLPYALSQISAAGIARSGATAAVAVIMMIVPIAIFIASQSNIIETMASSGIKE
ncbi:ABC-type glycerol-3-phosphate transport system, permease component [Butyrivibrio fibrisolvens DSM 3071]|jgi:ABC-type glycerol-3-phosphate transport system permease component|uniref:ABC-type glycerol-3-phosphate transport system, permease component n=1 Tax=Butyrivibrio fibrisolvens DSM 3071 TaxID=1121131 RepID=A0A1M5YNQ9_BUTFI|nr:carbohydrate ABC transporter permease [Butyrivibrio fibrisolvens]SHI13672.1 ABC-type glycerol-3-phosphate transport system, permease component [Butyrivibrio fibrisolvens DSM 3071]